jgi:pimeloyl-ACP methyl ester carboxylesterase
MAQTLRITAGDGRTLRVTESGDPKGRPVVVHHGTPMDGTPPPAAVADAERNGLRLIAYDRPGYGGSDAQPGRTIADCASDVAGIADALGIDRFVTWGISGGGPHALACGALLPERVAAVASISGVGPYDADDLDFMAGMGEGNVEEFGAAVEGAETLDPLLRAEAEAMAATGTDALLEAMRTVLSDLDAQALDGELGAYLHASVQAGLAPGIAGWSDDDLAITRPWGFDLEDITAPVLVAQGAHDLMVPPAHGAWLAAHIPTAEARLRDDEGHVTLLRDIAEIQAWLAARL